MSGGGGNVGAVYVLLGVFVLAAIFSCASAIALEHVALALYHYVSAHFSWK